MKFSGSKHGEAAPPSPFHAVEIVPVGKACQAAKGLTGTRFLSSGSPPIIPLAECDRQSTCQCRYRHHEDRRSEMRRDSDYPWSPRIPFGRGVDRRTNKGRRSTD